MIATEAEETAPTMFDGSDAPLRPASVMVRRALKTKKKKKKKKTDEEEEAPPKVLLDDDEFAAGKPAVFPSAPLAANGDDGEDEEGDDDDDDDDEFAVSPVQCASSNLATAEGIQRCRDVCEPGMCCMAEQGQRIEFTVSTGSSVELDGCRTESNAAWCNWFEGCESAFAVFSSTLAQDEDADLDAADLDAAAADVAVESSSRHREHDPADSSTMAEDVASSPEIETQCRSSVVAFDEGAAERCADACEPGLCCLADEGRKASFSVPGKAGGTVTLVGCRSPSNEVHCFPYLACSGAFKGLEKPKSGEASVAETIKATASTAVAAAATGATELHQKNPTVSYAVGAVALVILGFLAAVRRWRGREERGRRRPSYGEYERVNLLEANDHDEDDDGTGSLRGKDNDEDDDSEASPAGSNDDDDEEEGDVENSRDESQQLVISQPDDWFGWSNKKFFGS